jgi:chromosome segregation ATPase
MTKNSSADQVASSELKRQIRAAVGRLTELGRERRALQEVQQGLAAEAQTLAEQTARAQAEHAELQRQQQQERQRVAEVEQQIEAMELEAPIIERRHNEHLARAQSLGADRAEIERSIQRYERGLNTSGVELRLLKESLAHLDHRLQLKGCGEPGRGAAG